MQTSGPDLPRTECLKDVLERFLPYWETDISKDLTAGKTVLVAAHGNSLRALVKHLDGISDADIAALNIPTGIPLVYELDENLKPVKAGGTYLDPEAAAASIKGGREPGQALGAADRLTTTAASLGKPPSFFGVGLPAVARPILRLVQGRAGLPFAGHQVGDLPCHGHAVVGEAFEVPAGKGDVDGGWRGFVPVRGRHGPEDACMEFIDPGVRGIDFVAQLKVPRLKQLRHLARDLDVQRGKLVERGTDLLGNHIGGYRRRASCATWRAEVAHPLERSAHAQGANDHPQVAGNRPLEGKDVDGALVEGVLEEVDARVSGDYFLGKFGVGTLESAVGFLDGLRHQLRDLNQFLANLVKLGLKNLTHVGVLSVGSFYSPAGTGPQASFTALHERSRSFR
jgi:hypothetical protein